MLTLTNQSDSLIYIGIGGGSGAPEAIQSLLAELPLEQPVVCIIAQHWPQEEATLLFNLLARASRLPLCWVEDEVEPAPGQVYLTPPGLDVWLDGKRLRLHTPAAADSHPHPSINRLFYSLAQQGGDQVIGVLLSGMGTDGADGIRQIKSHGGMALVQEAQLSLYSSMPRAAINTGLIDLVLHPEQLGAEVNRLIGAMTCGVEPDALAIEQTRLMERLLAHLLQVSGVDFHAYKLSTLHHRLERRKSLNKLSTLEQYVQLLENSGSEAEQLFKELLISVTGFFRDAPAFSHLQLLIERMVAERETGDSLRVWVPAAATGEEPYSIAMLFLHACEQQGKALQLQIFATDLDEDALLFARQGVYSSTALTEVPELLRARYFQQGQHYYHVNKTLRESVIFARHDVLNDPPFSKVDLISCRNLLIYLNEDARAQLLRRLHYALRHGGYLFLGHAETLASCPGLFEPISRQAQLYQRVDTISHDLIDFLQVQPQSNTHTSSSTPSKSAQERLDPLRERLEQQVVHDLLPASLIIDGQGNLVQIRGDLSAYLAFPQGRVEMNLLKLLREELRVDMHSLFARVRDEGQVSGVARSYNLQHPDQFLLIHLMRLGETHTSHEAYGVVLQNFPRELIGLEFDDEDGDEVTLGQVQHLRHELMTMQGYLNEAFHYHTQEKEALQQQVQGLQSINEELQSMIEELTTTTREYQSVIEELGSLNDELESRVEIQQHNNQQLEGILGCFHLPMIILDQNLRMQRCNVQAAELFGIAESDLGQEITRLSYLLPFQSMRKKLLQSIRMVSAQKLVTELNNQHYRVRIIPFSLHDDERAVNVILVFEKQHMDQAEIASSTVLRMVQRMADPLEDAVLVVDPQGTIVHVNAAFIQLTGHQAASLLTESLNRLIPTPFREQHDQFMGQYMHNRQRGESRIVGCWRELSLIFSDGERRLVKLRFEDIAMDDEVYLVSFIRPITMTSQLQS